VELLVQQVGVVEGQQPLLAEVGVLQQVEEEEVVSQQEQVVVSQVQVVVVVGVFQ